MQISMGKTDCNPIEVGYDESRIEALNTHLEKLINNEEILCATYCISRKGKIIAQNGIGKQSYNKNDNRHVPHDAIQYLASITKLFTATAIMKLVEDGHIRLDNYVQEILPQFKKPPFTYITIFQLLTHTSGMHPDGNCFPNDSVISPWELIGSSYSKHKSEDGEFDWIEASLGFDMRNGPAFTYSEGTYNHEGAGACALYIDPVEELVASWFVPFINGDWHPNAMWNVINIIWSGLV